MFLRRFVSIAQNTPNIRNFQSLLFTRGLLTDDKLTKTAETEAWDEVEDKMFNNKLASGVKIPELPLKRVDRHDRKPSSGKSRPQHTVSKPEKQHVESSAELVTDSEIGEYLKLDRDDRILDDLMLSVQSKKHRDRDQILILEGRRIIQEAFSAGLRLKQLVFSKIEQVKLMPEILQAKPKLIKIANHNLKFWSHLSTAPGVMGIFERPLDMNAMIEKKNPNPLPITVICDNIREPGNLGALIRVAAAAGVNQVILSKGCTNPWELKVVRGSSGAHFRVKMVGPVYWDQISHIIPKDSEIYVAQNKAGSYPIINYENLSFTGKGNEKVLIVGSEAHGISQEAENILNEWTKGAPKAGSFINIPLAKDIDSLNLVSAASIILFEMRRKVLEEQFVNDNKKE